jgi:predicted dehydrogenase
MRILNVAIVGCGMVSELHHRALGALPELALVGVHDVDPLLRRQRAAAWGVQAYETLERLLEDDGIDAVLVLTPEVAHLPVAEAALQAGKHVLVEKPVSADPAGARRLAARAADRGLVAMPAHNYAYVPEFTRLARLARAGELGRIRSVFATYAIAHPETVARAYGGVLAHIMTHHSYLVLALLGMPTRVHAGASTPAWVVHEAEDQAWMTWEYETGEVAHLSASFAVGDDSADPWSFVVKALGTEGSASMTFRSAYLRRALGTLGFGLPVYEESYEHELRAFAATIDGGGAPLSTMADAADCAEIVAGAYAAIAAGRPWSRGA